ncbi:hypothetical protein ABZP36_018559 [Zizania latifolia]
MAVLSAESPFVVGRGVLSSRLLVQLPVGAGFFGRDDRIELDCCGAFSDLCLVPESLISFHGCSLHGSHALKALLLFLFSIVIAVLYSFLTRVYALVISAGSTSFISLKITEKLICKHVAKQILSSVW